MERTRIIQIKHPAKPFTTIKINEDIQCNFKKIKKNHFNTVQFQLNYNCLHELSKINKDLVFPSIQQASKRGKETERVEQLSFLILESQIRDELEKFTSSYNQFHILTYGLDEAYQISEIIHYLPNPNDNIAYFVEDLSDFISGAELTEEDRDVVAPEMNDDVMDPAAFDIGIYEDEQQNS